jgi:hypothetical protein
MDTFCPDPESPVPSSTEAATPVGVELTIGPGVGEYWPVAIVLLQPVRQSRTHRGIRGKKFFTLVILSLKGSERIPTAALAVNAEDLPGEIARAMRHKEERVTAAPRVAKNRRTEVIAQYPSASGFQCT